MNRNELISRIREEKKAAQTAGAIHRRDLHKHIKRMERQLREYDRYRGWPLLEGKESMKTG